jgi:hypothetical protein
MKNLRGLQQYAKERPPRQRGLTKVELEAENARLRERLEAAEKAAPDSGLRDALKPFAEFANEYLGNSRSQPKSGEVYTVHFTDNGPKSITIEMLKAAQSALQSPAPQGDVK